MGINAVRELCNRCPLVMTEDLLRDLVEYKTYKDKGVMMASKSLIQLFRNQNPELLHKRDRGRPTEAVATMKEKRFGDIDIHENVPGAEVIDVSMTEPTEASKEKDEDDEDSEWENVSHPSDNEDEQPEQKFLSLEEKAAKASEVTLGRILTDEDFKKIDNAQLKKQVQGVRRNPNKATPPPKGGMKRTADDADLDNDEENSGGGRNELVNLADIELIHKKRKHDKEARLESVLKGREDRGKFGGGRKAKLDENSSTSNKQKNKKKNFSMLKHKIKAKQTKKSFREKQQELKKRLVKQRKFK